MVCAKFSLYLIYLAYIKAQHAVNGERVDNLMNIEHPVRIPSSTPMS